MRITNGSDPVFDKLVTGKDKYLFNLLYRIRGGSRFLPGHRRQYLHHRPEQSEYAGLDLAEASAGSSGPSGNRRLSEPMPC